MLNGLKKYFGENIISEELKEKPKVALFLATRPMYRVEIEGIAFILVQIKEQEQFGLVALKKQREIYIEQFQCNMAYYFDTMTRTQRDGLLKNKIPFVSSLGQIYLPFLGLVLNENFKKEKKIKTEKMMPITQTLFFVY